MAVWAIGDIQGCLDPLQRLLDAIAFDPAADQLWFCGDLVNRGGQSLETLRLIHGLGTAATVVLGNHDLSLLSIAARPVRQQRRVKSELQRVLFADDGPQLIAWLQQRPLLHADRELGAVMVHAGLSPRWTLEVAERRAAEVERALRDPSKAPTLLSAMYGDRPDSWSARLRGTDRLRTIINVFTRLRFCTPRGRMVFSEKGAPGSQPAGLYPWFSVPGVVKRDLPVICGHWSALGLHFGNGICALDTGAVWSGRLTALRLDDFAAGPPRFVQVEGQPAAT